MTEGTGCLDENLRPMRELIRPIHTLHRLFDITVPMSADGCSTISHIDVSEEHSELSSVDVSACKGLVSLRVAGLG